MNWDLDSIAGCCARGLRSPYYFSHCNVDILVATLFYLSNRKFLAIVFSRGDLTSNSSIKFLTAPQTISIFEFGRLFRGFTLSDDYS